MKVDFMIIGAQKCASSSLTYILKMHPNISFCREDEPHYFTKTAKWKEHISEYHSMFKSDEVNVLFGEGSTSYTFYGTDNREIWNILYEYNPSLKLIYMVRNPIERIVSAYMHSYSRGYTSYYIDEALHTDHSYINTSKYYLQISPFIERFGRDKVLLIDFEDFNKRRSDEMLRVADFLGIDATLFSSFQEVHANKSLGGDKIHHRWDKHIAILKNIGSVFPKSFRKRVFNSLFVKRQFHDKPVLSTETKKKIIEELEDDIHKLEKLMNKDYSVWLLK